MRHYISLSLDHFVQKYCKKTFEKTKNIGHETHGWRATARPSDVCFPSDKTPRKYTNDDELDPSEPKREHIFVAADS